ncbi:melanoma-associated antigen B16-like [Physeter macrocephalus]|uniref:Melanoma-associated antigen B16-like n=1 Tax=Physeter macrocephalus TaxID=9755 RepID=A0A2Y9EQ75_PHYMC|nr:melanoma-associated antigen B16-like [Physeter catodon]|eukprot:XP_007106119.2 melanoma-associated antigen B16-like [Physeter catodon]
MIQRQKRPQYSYEQCHQTFSKSQDLKVAQVSKALEETQLSSHPLMPGDLKEASGAGISSTPEGPQSFCSSSIAIKATSPTKSDEGSNSQEREYTLSTSQAVLDPKNVPIDALEKKVAMLVDFLLFKYQMKEPVTKADMLKIVIKECEVHFSEIFLRASERMELIFGLDLMEVDHANHHYGLFIKLGLTYDGMLHVERGMPKTGILMLILGVIFMKGNRDTEDEVWEVLNVTGIYSGMKHFICGEPRELITKEFVKEKYLEYRQVANTDPAQFEFLWGPRAHAETTKMKVLEFLAKIHGTDPSSFPSQYGEALQDEEESEFQAGLFPSVATASSSVKASNFSHT